MSSVLPVINCRQKHELSVTRRLPPTFSDDLMPRGQRATGQGAGELVVEARGCRGLTGVRGCGLDGPGECRKFWGEVMSEE